MKISSQSELMKNHKAARIMQAGSQFQALQTNEGHSLFFSIGTAGILYLSKETPKDALGWDHHDLSSGLSTGVNVFAKTFQVAQNNKTGNIDLALAATIDGKDHLYLSRNNCNSDTSWSSQMKWDLIEFDDNDHKLSNPAIAEIFIPQNQGGEIFIVDVLTENSGSLKTIFRYFVDPAKTVTGRCWNAHDTSAQLQAGSISSIIGRRAEDHIDGIYTLGSIAGKEELIFTPLYARFNPETAPTATILDLPSSATAIAVAPNTDDTTNLFIAADKALYFFPSDQQKKTSQAIKIMDHGIFSGVKKLFANVVNSQVTVWGMNQGGDIFYLKCPAGHELTGTAWSYPVPFFSGAEQISPYINTVSNHSIIFANLNGQQLVQLSQDPASASWQQRSVLLPATDPDHVLEYHSFSTHVHVTDDNNLPIGKPVTLSFTSPSPVGIFVNNTYHKLSASTPVDIETDVTGALTIIQETQAVAAICYHARAEKEGVSLEINPMGKVVDTLKKVQSPDDLNLSVSDEEGNSKQLLPSDTPQDQRNATASAIRQFATAAGTLPSDGSKATQATRTGAAFTVSQDTMWGIIYGKDKWVYHEGDAVLTNFGLTYNTQTNKLEIVAEGVALEEAASTVETVAEDIWNWLKSIYHEVERFFVQLVEGVYHFFVSLGEKIYHFIVDCISAIVHAVEFVFNKIRVFFEDLVKWLGFIFNWGDIVRTHKVIKNLLLKYVASSIDSIETIRTGITDQFGSLIKNINNWADLPKIDDSAGSYTSNTPSSGQNSPQSRWGIYHAQNNMDTASSDYTPGTPGGSGVLNILQDLKNLLEKEEKTFKEAYDDIKDTIEKFSTLSFTEVVKKIVAIIVKIALKTLENVVTTMLDIFRDVLHEVVELLNATIQIPVISWLYEKVAKAPLSILDLTCLVVSIPTTIIYKLAKEETPFPDDTHTQSLIDAPDFAAIQKICAANATLQTRVANQMTLNDKLVFAGNCMAFAGSICVSVVNIAKAIKPEFEKNGILSFIGGVFYLPYVAPGIIGSIQPLQEKKWYAIMNTYVTSIATLKAMVDVSLYKKDDAGEKGFVEGWAEASPWLEAFLNILWQFPTSGAVLYPENQNGNGIMALIGGTLFDIGGVMAPAVDVAEGVEKAILVGTTSICNLAYGSLALAQSLD